MLVSNVHIHTLFGNIFKKSAFSFLKGVMLATTSMLSITVNHTTAKIDVLTDSVFKGTVKVRTKVSKGKLPIGNKALTRTMTQCHLYIWISRAG